MELNDLHWPLAPQWALLAGQAGRWFILSAVVAFALSAIACALPKRAPALARPGQWLFTIGAVCVAGAFGCLASLFINQQFEYDYIRDSIQAGLELRYRVAAIWSHQEGSFLLWALTSCVFGVLAAPRMGIYRPAFTSVYALFVGSLAAILAKETPFNLSLVHGQALLPPEGAGLTPALQNYWVVIHPPTIFTGFGSLTVMFCAAVAAMVVGNSTDWVRMVRPWALASLSILGLGLCMGGFWAYETLGWGGFWGWDPVENTSFVPWILTATFAHGLMIQAAKRGWVRANVILGALPFISFLFGTYLTRSGVYADLSVHSFAQMNGDALKILLGVMSVATLGFAALLTRHWAGLRAQEPPRAPAEGLNRRDGQTAGVVVLCSIGLAVAFGTSVPLIEMLRRLPPKIVEEPLYHQVLGWFFPMLLLLMAVVPFLGWGGTQASKLWPRLAMSVSLAFMGTGFAVFFIRRSPFLTGQETVAFPFVGKIPTLPWIAFLLFLCFFAMLGNVARMFELKKGSKLGWGGFIAHIGIATFMAGMLISRGFEKKEQFFLQPGESVSTQMGYTVEFKDFTKPSIYDRDNHAEFVMQGADPVNQITAQPGLYAYRDSDGDTKWMTWPFIKHYVSHDVYFSLSQPQLDVWKDAVSILPGKSYSEGQVQVQYLHMTMHGAPGQAGTRFGAVVRVTTPTGVYQAEPTVEIGQGGLIPHVAVINRDLVISMQGIDANDQSVLLQVHFAKPIYPIELFYKPMTSLVWLGAGILALGVALSAFYRRNGLEPQTAAQPSPKPAPRSDDAIVPAPQM